MAATWNASAIVFEDTGAAVAMAQELRGETTLPLIAVKPEGSKELRAQTRLPAGRGWKGLRAGARALEGRTSSMKFWDFRPAP